jgi:YfiH family protein
LAFATIPRSVILNDRMLSIVIVRGDRVRGSMKLVERSGLVLGIFPVLEIIAPRLEVLQSTRVGGASGPPFDSLNIGSNVGDKAARVERNRKLLLEAAGIGARRLARAEQVHGAHVEVAERGSLYGGADGLVTAESGLALAVSTADCYPVIVYAASERVLAALHVGRGGAEGGIIGRAIDLMSRRFAIDTRNCVAVVGPGICWRCYEVGPELASRFSEPFRKEARGRSHIDLRAFCRAELESRGIPAGRIYESAHCTSCEPDLFFSHRRDRGETGRHWTLARIGEM